MDFIDAKIRVDIRLGDIGFALEGWEPYDIGKLVGVMLFGGNSYTARDLLNKERPLSGYLPLELRALFDGLYDYASHLAWPLEEIERTGTPMTESSKWKEGK